MNNDLGDKVEELNDYLVMTRRYLHENPELSGKELKTADFLKNEIRKMNIPIEQVSKTGFIATLTTGKNGKTVALRTDIDALPIQEDKYNLKNKRTCYSKNDGVAHLCGHDGHMAILLSTMKILNDLKDSLKGTIIFIFEEGEETCCGIHDMVENLKDKQIDAIYGTHLTSFMETGTICIDEGPRMAGAAGIGMYVHGKGGHGSRPDLSINPIFGAVQVLNGIASAWNNQLDVSKTVTLGLTQIHGGQINNVIPDKVYIGGSLRFFDLEEGEKALDIVKNVASLTAKAHNCTVTFEETMRVALAPVINDKFLSKIAQKSVIKIMPNSLVKDINWYASESFSHYSKVAPSVFSFVGIGNAEFGSGAEHHNKHFDLDEASLPYAVKATTQFAIDFLNT